MKFRGALVCAGIATAGLVITARHYRDWGATPAEKAATLPGDALVPDPANVTTRAVGIQASAEYVWPWLAQIGQDRAGMYSYDFLENLIGLNINSSREIRPEWQLTVGDRVVLVPKGWLGLNSGYSLPVQLIVPQRALVLRQAPPEHPWNAVWSFTIEPVDADHCRLISRGRDQQVPGLPGKIARVAALVMDPVTLVMTRKMLLGIKERAETDLGRSAPTSVYQGSTIGVSTSSRDRRGVASAVSGG